MNVILAHCQAKEHKALRWLLEQDPELNLVAETDETDSLLAQAQAMQPGLVLLDWELPGLEATDMLQALHCLGSPLKVVAFSDRAEAHQEAMAAGADAFVSKEEPVEELLKTVRAVGDLSPCILG
jgi:DNA-binding NarL/FixJ family response regulator